MSQHTPAEAKHTEAKHTENSVAAVKSAPPPSGDRRTRIVPESVIRMGKSKDSKPYGAENNPRGSKSACGQRFVNYRDGMTVAEARAAGMTAADIRSDSDKGYIVLETPTQAASKAA